MLKMWMEWLLLILIKYMYGYKILCSSQQIELGHLESKPVFI